MTPTEIFKQTLFDGLRKDFGLYIEYSNVGSQIEAKITYAYAFNRDGEPKLTDKTVYFSDEEEAEYEANEFQSFFNNLDVEDKTDLNRNL